MVRKYINEGERVRGGDGGFFNLPERLRSRQYYKAGQMNTIQYMYTYLGQIIKKSE